MTGTPDKQARPALVQARFDALADSRAAWMARNAAFHAADEAYLRFLIPEGLRVLVVGCGIGDLVAALRPARGVGIDISPRMIDIARARHPGLEFHCGDVADPACMDRIAGPFDVILLPGTIGFLDDCQGALQALHRWCAPATRLIVAYHSRLWEPLLQLAERLGLKMPEGQQNWLSTRDIMNLFDLAGFEPIRREWRQLVPRRAAGLGPLINRYLAPLPGIRRLCLRNYIVGRPRPSGPATAAPPPSVSVVIPCRNEKGNIENAVRRLPDFGARTEILFVEGHSRDGTFEECLRVQAAYPDHDIKVFRQTGKGKGDAVRLGFHEATGDVLLILDADLTTPPETMPRFYEAIASGRADFANGTRFVYPMAAGAMRFLNNLANRAFARAFSYLLNQRFTDTLCGTKAIRRSDYVRLAANRAYFGEFDPFGDFDLIFGAAKQNLKMVEIPIRYADRDYGSTNISRFTHGWLLLRMVLFAWRKLKAF
ncbi:MAG: glycosyltransferase [Alphaproteobacteria bacterium]|nr:glycosyltransferase [Alphaproteobacteria bacterium]